MISVTAQSSGGQMTPPGKFRYFSGIIQILRSIYDTERNYLFDIMYSLFILRRKDVIHMMKYFKAALIELP
jgi:hypothetical protein